MLLVCPGAPLADKFRAGEFEIVVAECSADSGDVARRIGRCLGESSPFYTYALPYRVNGKYYNIRDEHRRLSPVFSDASGDEQSQLDEPESWRPARAGAVGGRERAVADVRYVAGLE